MQFIRALFIPAFALLAGLSSCAEQENKIESLQTKVIEIHDEVMPKMDQIMDYQMQLKKHMFELDSMQKEGISSNTIAEQKLSTQQLIVQLMEADSSMYQWMYDFNPDTTKLLDEADALEYLKKEEQKINIVKEKTLKSLEDAKAFLDKKK